MLQSKIYCNFKETESQGDNYIVYSSFKFIPRQTNPLKKWKNLQEFFGRGGLIFGGKSCDIEGERGKSGYKFLYFVSPCTQYGVYHF